MNTNTVEQAEKLKKLGVESPFGFFEDENKKLICSNEWALRREYPEYQGPYLILDELHKVLEFIFDKYGFYCFPKIGYDAFEKIWILFGIGFKRTNNHAEDWTEILIWLLENGHVTALQVNEALK